MILWIFLLTMIWGGDILPDVVLFSLSYEETSLVVFYSIIFVGAYVVFTRKKYN